MPKAGITATTEALQTRPCARIRTRPLHTRAQAETGACTYTRGAHKKSNAQAHVHNIKDATLHLLNDKGQIKQRKDLQSVTFCILRLI